MAKQLGRLGILPRQAAELIREVETDGGEGTTLRLKCDKDRLGMCIAQYDAAKQLEQKGLVFAFTPEPVRAVCESKTNPSWWILTASNGVQLHLVEREDGVITVTICKEGGNPSEALQFAMDTHGQCYHVYCAWSAIVQLLRDEHEKMTHEGSIDLYVYIDKLYEDIGRESSFQELQA